MQPTHCQCAQRVITSCTESDGDAAGGAMRYSVYMCMYACVQYATPSSYSVKGGRHCRGSVILRPCGLTQRGGDTSAIQRYSDTTRYIIVSDVSPPLWPYRLQYRSRTCAVAVLDGAHRTDGHGYAGACPQCHCSLCLTCVCLIAVHR